MRYVQCHRCRARFHTGVIYESPESCPRCGGGLSARRSGFLIQLRAALGRRGGRESVDWEAVTGSQYLGRRGPATDHGGKATA